MNGHVHYVWLCYAMLCYAMLPRMRTLGVFFESSDCIPDRRVQEVSRCIRNSRLGVCMDSRGQQDAHPSRQHRRMDHGVVRRLVLVYMELAMQQLPMLPHVLSSLVEVLLPSPSLDVWSLRVLVQLAALIASSTTVLRNPRPIPASLE